MLELAPEKTIMDLIIDNLEEAGIEEIAIVTRAKFSHLFAKRYEGRVKTIETEYEDFGNLHSLEVLFPQLKVEDETLVVMSDHVFEVKMLRKLLEKKRHKPITICVDRNPPWDIVQEGLKIRLDEDRVAELGKDAPPYHGTDTGLFVFSKEIWPLIQEVMSKQGSNAEIISLLKEAEDLDLIEYVDVTGSVWIDIDTIQDLEKARKLYWAILRKNLIKPTDGLVSKYINRPISTRISLFLYKKEVKISPNAITLLTFLLGLASALILAQGLYIIGGLMVFLVSMLDGVDGELARLRGKITAFGGFLDSILDRYVDIMIIIALAYSIRWTINEFNALILILATAGVFAHSYIVHVAKFRRLDTSTVERLFPLASRDVRLFVVTLFCLISLPSISFILLAILPLIYTFVSFTQLKREEVKKVQLPKEVVSKVKTPTTMPILAEYRHTGKDKTLNDIKRNINLLASNVIKLIVSLFIINLLHYFDGVILLEFNNVTLTTTTLLDLVNMIAIITFGYKILLALNFFMNIASDYVIRKFGITLAAYRRLALDLIYLSGTMFIWIGLLPILKSLPGTGNLIGTVTATLLLIFLLFVIYDLIRMFYRSLEGIWNRVVERLSKLFEEIAKAAHH